MYININVKFFTIIFWEMSNNAEIRQFWLIQVIRFIYELQNNREVYMLTYMLSSVIISGVSI